MSMRSRVSLFLLPAVLACGTGAPEADVHLESEPYDDGDESQQGLISCQEHQDTGYRNGNSFRITVVTVDGKPAEVDTANAYWVMQQAAAEDGVALRIISGFRTMEEQRYLYACFVNCNCNNCNLAARPGTSNHQSGSALDLNTSSPGVYGWLDRHAARFGFKRTVPSEAWHWEYGGGGPGGGPCGAGGDLTALERTEAALQAHLHDPAASSDVDGDGRADLCARTSAGFRCFLAAGGFAEALDGPALDSPGWDRRNEYTTLRTADVDGDGRADVCGRTAEGFQCWRSRPNGFIAGMKGDFFDDANGWTDASQYSTIRMADVDGDGRADACGRTRGGFFCWPSRGDHFGPRIAGPEWSNDRGWDKPERYASIRMGDMDGDGRDDVCAHVGDSVVCFRSSGDALDRRVAGPDLLDESGWEDPARYSTLRMVDLDGDARADLCVRGKVGLRCFRSRGDSFGPAIGGPGLSDRGGWDERDNYSTLRFADIDGDGDRDVCARADTGMRCWRWNTDGFADSAIRLDEMTDDRRWDSPRYFRTIRLADFNGDGRADVAGRGVNGMRQWRSAGGAFESAGQGPEWSDARGWTRESRWATIRFALP